jgi:hypothetical protein
MAQVKLLKIASDGVPLEFTSSTDEITLLSFTVNGGGPVLSGTGLDMNNQDITDVNDLAFNDPTTGTINQTAGALVVDNIMAKERNNVMTSAGAVLFPTVTDTAAQLDSFKIPNVAGVPSATPSFSTTGGYMVYDSSNKNLYIWDGSAWDNLETSESVENSFVAGEALAARDVVYISAADNVSKALADSTSKSYAIGLAVTAASATANVLVRSNGNMSGFSALTSGSRYYLDDAVAGALTATIPSASGKTIVQVGYAKSATELAIQILQLGRRA